MPLDRRRRARRSAGPVVLTVVLVAVVLFFVLGGIAFLGQASAPYRRAVNRSFAQQGSVLVDQGNQSALELRRMMANLPTLRRAQVRDRLDSLVAATGSQSAGADLLTPPQPASGVGPAMTTVFADRATAVSSLRAAVYGLLGLEPEPVTGAAPVTPASTVPGQGTALLPSARATADLRAVGTTLERADQQYAALRHTLATSAGNGHLPRSVWVTHPQAWSYGALSTLVDELVSSPSLGVIRSLELLTVSIDPAAVPPPGGPTAPGGVSTVPPTRTLAVSVVLRNNGNITAHDIVVTASVDPLHRGRSDSSHQQLSLTPGASTSTDLPPLRVQPGADYTLRVRVTSPSLPGGGGGPSTSYTIAVAPNAPPPTTTTTAPPPAHSTSSTAAHH